MKHKKVILILFLSWFFNDIHATPLDKAKVKQLVKKYFTLMEVYSDLPSDKSANDYRSQLIDIFDVNVRTGIDFASDLFTADDQSNLSVYDYLTAIEDKYQNKIQVEFINDYYFGCTSKIGNKEFAYVSVDKTLEYVGEKQLSISSKSKKVNQLIGIDISQSEYKINMIVFRPYKEKNNSCILDQSKDEQITLFNEYSKYGDTYYASADYVSAKNLYEKSLLYKSNDSRVLNQVNLCNKILNYESYKTSAEKYLSEKKFNKATEIFTKISNEYSEHKLYAQNKIKECDNGIRMENYNFYKNLAYESFNKSLFSKAVDNFNKALTFDVSEKTLINEMIHKCNTSNHDFAKGQIKQAVYLAEKKHDYVGAYKLLSYYEMSGLLNGQNYYFMAMMMDGNESNIRKKMHYSKNQAYHLAKEYCLKGRNLGNQNAEFMWERILNGKSKTDY